MDNKTAAAAVDTIASATAQIVLQQQGGDVKEQPQAQAHQQDEEDGGDGSKRQQPISTAAVPQPQQQPQGLEVVETDPTKRYLRVRISPHALLGLPVCCCGGPYAVVAGLAFRCRDVEDF
jgi:hypothetical protein